MQLNDNQLKALSLPVSSRDELKKAITAKQNQLGEKRYSVRELTKSKLDLLRAAQDLEIDLSSYTSIDGARSSKDASVTASVTPQDAVSADDVDKAWFDAEQADHAVGKARSTLEKVKALEGEGNEAIIEAAQAVFDKAQSAHVLAVEKAKAVEDAHKAQQLALRQSSAVTAPSLADIEWHDAQKVFGNKSKALKGVQVPVFVGNHDSEIAQHVPTADPNFFFGYEDGELLRDVLISFGAVYKSGNPSNSNTWLWGQRGAGKSELVKQISARTNRPMFTTSCHRELTIEQLGGEFDPRSVAQGGNAPVLLEPSFAKGIATAHAIVVLDEVGRVNPTNAVGFNGTLETRVLNRIDGTQVPFAEGVTIAVTDNTDGSGDPTGQFEAYPQDQSFLDRFRAVIKVPFLPQNQEAKVLIAKEGICAPVANLIVKIMASFRGATDGSGGHQARALYPSLRGAFAMAYALREGKAFRRAIVHHLIGSACPSDQQIADVLVNSIAPSDDEVREVLNGIKSDFNQ